MDPEQQPLMIMSTLREPFHLFTTTLLSLLLPLSFLLIARLSDVYYLLPFVVVSSSFPAFLPFNSFVFSLFFYANPVLLHVLVSLFTLATLIHGLTTGLLLILAGKPDNDDDISIPAAGVVLLRRCLLRPPRLYVAWIFLCTLQVCVGLGVEGSIAAGIEEGINYIRRANYDHGENISLLSRIVFLVGLHETMIHWCKMIVKPVVDDTVFGGPRDDKVVEKVAMAACCGALWWWKLRDEVESMVIVSSEQLAMQGVCRLTDFVGWWLYYLTVTVGMVKIARFGMVKIVRFGSILSSASCRRSQAGKIRYVLDHHHAAAAAACEYWDVGLANKV